MGAYSGLNIDPAGFGATDASGDNIIANSGGIADQEVQQLGGAPILPDATTLDLPGQLPGIPGGGASNGAAAPSDPSGMNSLHLSGSVNPTPTGNYMTALAAVASAAATGMSTYAKGSPSVAIPAALRPGTIASSVGGLFTTATGGTNWLVVGGVVAVGIIGLIVLTKYV